MVAEGATNALTEGTADAFADTHRLVGLAAVMVPAGSAGGVVRDVVGRPPALDVDLAPRRSGGVMATRDELSATLRAARADAVGPLADAAGPLAE